MNTTEEYIAAMQPKLCINCKHIGRNGSGDAMNFRCFAEQNIIAREVDLVTGAAIIKRWFLTCYDARAEGVQRRENCGPEGKWFEEKPTMEIVPTGKPGEYTSRPIKGQAAADLLSQLDKMP